MNACRSCKAPVEWVRNAATGKALPIDVDPSPVGNVVKTGDVERGTALVRVLSRRDLDAAPPRGVDRYLSHFATCPQAGSWRRR